MNKIRRQFGFSSFILPPSSFPKSQLVPGSACGQPHAGDGSRDTCSLHGDQRHNSIDVADSRNASCSPWGRAGAPISLRGCKVTVLLKDPRWDNASALIPFLLGTSL